MATAPLTALTLVALLARTAAGGNEFGRFCGIAVNNEQGNGFAATHLNAAAVAAGAQRVWHYNWKPASDIQVSGVEFVPMVKFPGRAGDLPPANANGVGTLVKGWNEPDDQGQAGIDSNLRTNPGAFALAWTSDMQVARGKGYTDFVSPAMAHDSCWLDHFLQACDTTTGCKELVTYLGFHRYRNDCGTYVADSSYIGWRDDLGYVLSFYRLVKKYNERGFQIKGLIWDEFGCLNQDFSAAAPEAHQRNYMVEWYQKTVVEILRGNSEVVDKVTGTDWIGPAGPDASSSAYTPGACQWQNGGAEAAADAVKAIQNVRSMAWFSIAPGTNHLFHGSALSSLGELYFRTCSLVSATTGDNAVGQGIRPLLAGTVLVLCALLLHGSGGPME